MQLGVWMVSPGAGGHTGTHAFYVLDLSGMNKKSETAQEVKPAQIKERHLQKLKKSTEKTKRNDRQRRDFWEVQCKRNKTRSA